MKIEFTEKQKFRQWWLWIILIGSILPIIYRIYQRHFIEDNPSPYLPDIIFCILSSLIISMFLIVQLKTEIDQNEIRISFFPFIKKKINWKQIKKVEIVSYGFVGGWGIRKSTKYGTIYNIKGNKGLAIELLHGKKYLIGTQKETELREIVKKLKPT